MSDLITLVIYIAIGIVVCSCVLIHNVRHDCCIIDADDIESPMAMGCLLMLPVLAWPGVVALFAIGKLGQFALKRIKKYE